MIERERCRSKPECFGYNADCPLGLGFYSHISRDNCFDAPECFDDWVESGGRLDYPSHLEELKKEREQIDIVLKRRIETSRILS